MKRKTIDCYYNPVVSRVNSTENPSPIIAQDIDPVDLQAANENAATLPSLEAEQGQEIVATAFERDPGKRAQIFELPADQQDEARRFYISEGPFRPILQEQDMAQIDKVMVRQSDEIVAIARLRLTTTIDSIRWLTFQGCPFRGHDEPLDSINRGNFLEIDKLLASYNKEVKEVVLENAPKNAKYTSSEVQKEILSIVARKVQKSIREEIGTSKFCIMADEARDESKKEQMAIVLRFVNKEGLIKECFLDLVHVSDTHALTLKNSICAVLSGNNLNVQDIRSQGYDGASNMRGEWNGLKALILNECPYAYYINCMAHQLQLALVAASREVQEVHNFFQHANFIINVVSASPKRNDELLANQTTEIAREIELGELDTGRGANQITDVLCQTLQKKAIDILNALDSVSNTKALLADLRNEGWEPLVQEVKSFCEKHEIDIPNLNNKYVDVTKSQNKNDNTTAFHYYKVDVFNVAIDQQMIELEDRFGSQATDLLALCVCLESRLESFDMAKVCTLVEKYYPADFSSQERAQLECQLPHFQLDVCNHPDLSILPSLAEITSGLLKTGKSCSYPMVDRLLRLILTLPVSTATTESFFSYENCEDTSSK
ncbi:uncharacterized protein LOC127782046 [Oryza glaberrima]|uniref:uncharacterized protein LOC127782046 n=1 Tax=Oryza glaberrima TaxID=4538 RepID=UPI00224C4046|nr:uncharacterized protein LOC127782046 [Oryza glaberrima]